MKKLLFALMALFSFASFSQQLEISFEQICAFPDDSVMDKVDFVLLGDSGQISKAPSKKISITPGACKKKEALPQYSFSIPVYTMGDPLRLQLASQSLLFYKLDENKIFVGDKAQLNRVKNIENATCFDMEELYKEDKVVELISNFAKIKVHLHLKKP